MTRAQSCFLRKAFSSRCASPRLVTWGGGTEGCRGCLALQGLQHNKQQLPGAGVKTMAAWPRAPAPPLPLDPEPDEILFVMILWESGEAAHRPSPYTSP